MIDRSTEIGGNLAFNPCYQGANVLLPFQSNRSRQTGLNNAMEISIMSPILESKIVALLNPSQKLTSAGIFRASYL